MNVRRRIALCVLWAASVAGVAAWSRAQEPRVVQPMGQMAAGKVIIAGENLGFRVEQTHGKTRIGTLVVRIDGEWVDTQFAMKVAPVK